MTDASDLKISVAEPRSWARRLTITVPAQRVQKQRSSIAKSLAGSANLKGFRKGRVPASVIEQRYGPAIDQETVERVVQSAFQEAVSEQGLEPISQGAVENLNYEAGADLTFDVEFEVRPQVAIERTEGFKVRAQQNDVGEEDVEKVLGRLREENASWTPLQAGSNPKPGDRVKVEITPVRADEEPEPRPYEFVLGQDEAIPDVEAAVQTLEPGGVEEFEIEVPATDEAGEVDESAEPEQQTVRIRLVEANRPDLPELDDEFASGLGDFEDLATLREHVREDLEAEAASEAERQLRRDLMDQVVEANPFDVPDSMVRRYLQTVFRLPEDADPAQIQQIEQAARPSAESALRRMMALEAIADAQGLRATQDEIDERVEQIAEANDASPSEAWSNLQRSGRLQSVEDEITERKVYEYLKQRSTIEQA